MNDESNLKIELKIMEMGLSKFKNLSITEFSNKVDLSPSTISRYIRGQGFENYKAYQFYLKDFDNGLFRDHDYSDKIANLGQKIVEIFKDVKSARRILTIGFGSSSHAPNELALGLTQLGLAAIYIHQFQYIMQVFPSLQSDDVLIIFSEKAINREITFLLGEIKNYPAKCWLIGSYRNFPKVKNVVILESEKKEIVKTSNESSIINQNIFVAALLRYYTIKCRLQNYKVQSKALANKWNR